MIDINEIGATAFVIASIRALEPEKSPRLFDDPCAEWFSNDRARSAARQMDAAFPPSTTMVRIRTRYFNRFVERGIAAGARQVVLLGGGFDMRAHNLARPGVAFFEVDQQARARIQAHGAGGGTGSSRRHRSSATTWRSTCPTASPKSASISTRRR